MKLGLLFPGQGSQHVGMGRELSDASPAAAGVFEQADEILGVSLTGLMWDGPEEELRQTRNTQPAILTHSTAVLAALGERLAGAVIAAGHSLGEYSAHVAAGTLSFEDGLKLVRLRGELMSSAGSERDGAMAAVLGLGDEVVIRICEDVSVADSVVVPANFNSDGQVVVSGDASAVERAMTTLKDAGAKRVLPLNVSGAFHSPLMKAAEAELETALEAARFDHPRFPVVSNVTAEPVTVGDEARRLLIEQLTSPVSWTASVHRMVAMDVEAFAEIGPGSVLCGLNRRSAKGIPCSALGTPESIDQWDIA